MRVGLPYTTSSNHGAESQLVKLYLYDGYMLLILVRSYILTFHSPSLGAA